MNRAHIYVLVLVPHMALSAALDSTGTPHGERGIAETDTSKGSLVQRFVVPHFRSAVFATGSGGRVTSVITATNGGEEPCDVAFDYYFAFNSNAVPVCTINLTLVPLLASGTDTINACSRPISGDRWTLCTASCSPALSFVQGKVVVRAGQSCAADLALDARLYHSDTSDDVIAVTQMAISSDLDGDGIFDPNDNCSAVANPGQHDSNDDGFGNRCDADLNNDCVVNLDDLGLMRSAFFSTPESPNWNPDADLAGHPDGGPDGNVNLDDLGVMRAQFFGAPGPSDLQNLCL